MLGSSIITYNKSNFIGGRSFCVFGITDIIKYTISNILYIFIVFLQYTI